MEGTRNLKNVHNTLLDSAQLLLLNVTLHQQLCKEYPILKKKMEHDARHPNMSFIKYNKPVKET